MQMIEDDPFYQTPAEEKLQEAQDALTTAEEYIGLLETALEEIHDMFSDEMDADQDTDGTWRPNDAMKICTLIDEALGKGKLKL